MLAGAFRNIYKRNRVLKRKEETVESREINTGTARKSYQLALMKTACSQQLGISANEGCRPDPCW